MSSESHGAIENRGRLWSLAFLSPQVVHGQVLGFVSQAHAAAVGLRKPWGAANVHVCRVSEKRPRTPCFTMSAKKDQKKKQNTTPRIDNRIARMRYEFLQTYECGIELVGTEIKSVRQGKMNIREGYARVKDGEIFLHNVHIAQWESASGYFNHDPTRPRKLLLHKRHIRKLAVEQQKSSLTIVPTKAYFSNRFLKVEIALARGKQLHDRREDIKKREDQRNIQRAVKASMGY